MEVEGRHPDSRASASPNLAPPGVATILSGALAPPVVVATFPLRAGVVPSRSAANHFSFNNPPKPTTTGSDGFRRFGARLR